MALELPYGIKLLINKANVDERYGPYSSIQEALSGTTGTREIGLTVGININNSVVEYWFKSGVQDVDLIEKTTNSTGSVEDVIHNSSGSTTLNNNDEFTYVDSSNNWILRKINWSNIKLLLKSYFDNIYSTFSGSYNDLDGKPDLSVYAEKDYVDDQISGLTISYTDISGTPENLNGDRFIISTTEGVEESFFKQNEIAKVINRSSPVSLTTTYTFDLSENLTKTGLVDDGQTSLSFDYNIPSGFIYYETEIKLIINNENNNSPIETITFTGNWDWPVGVEPTGGMAANSKAILKVTKLSSNRVFAAWFDL